MNTLENCDKNIRLWQIRKGREGGEIYILINGNTMISGEDQVQDKITEYMAD